MTQQQMQYAYWQRMRQQQLYRLYAAGAATQPETPTKNAYDTIAKVSDNYFLNYLEYSPKNLDSKKAVEYLKKNETVELTPGRCTGVYDQNSGKVLRQLDWYYNNETEFIVKMNADSKKGIYGSIGVTAASPKMTTDLAEHYITTGEYYDYLEVLPFFTVDGINDQGVFAQSNVVNKNDVEININNGIAGKEDCCIVMLVRYILDHFTASDLATAEAVKTKLMKNLHIYGTSKLGGYNSHILVACHSIKKSYVIEFTATDIVVNEFPIMTNFRTINDDLDPIGIDENYMIDWDEIEQDGIGLERWETCAKFLKQNAGSLADVYIKLLRSQLDYTHAYDRPFQKNITWLTDNLSGDLTVANAKDCHDNEISQEFQAALDGYRAQFNRRQRTDNNITWITTHSAIYDLVSLSCNIKSQMSTTEETCWNVLSSGQICESKEEYGGLCFTAEEPDSTVTLQNVAGIYQTSTDGQKWTDYVLGTEIALHNAGDKVYFAAKTQNDTCWNGKEYPKERFIMSGKIAASGNIQSLIDNTCQKLDVQEQRCYKYIFYNCTALTKPPMLLATTLSYECYCSMFLGCTSLMEAPILPAAVLADRCYSCMFLDCSSLTAAPELPAATLAPFCYDTMFKNCISLSAVPALSSKNLYEYCYANMFHGCVSLTQSPTLPATTLADNCYMGMFNNCSALTAASELCSTELADSCYKEMFHGCQSLNISENEEEGAVVLNLPSGTTTKDEWNSDMFSGTGGRFTGDPAVGNTYRCYS